VPGFVRPARPRLWRAAARETHTSTRREIFLSASYWFSFTLPESTTYITSSMVMEVFVTKAQLKSVEVERNSTSATLVEAMIFHFCVALKTFPCSSEERFACRGRMIATESFTTVRTASQQRLISCTPGRKISMPPFDSPVVTI
jgi:hypothetical protein